MKKIIFLVSLVFAAFTGSAQIVLNEIYVRPDGLQTTPPNGIIYSGSKEYIELYNKGCTTIDVSGYFLADKQILGTSEAGFTFRIPNVPAANIPPGGHIVLGPESPGVGVVGNVDIPITAADRCSYSANLIISNVDGWVALYDASGVALDCVYWSGSAGNIANPNDFDPGTLCLPAGSPAVTLQTPTQINNSIPAIVSYISTASPILIYRQQDGSSTWSFVSTYNAATLPWTINNASPTGNCNGGNCSPLSCFSYASPFCTVGTAAPSVPSYIASGGTFTSTNGLIINSVTGVIDLAASTPGTYTVTYTPPINSGSQPFYTTQVTIYGGTPTANITYTGSPFCKSITTAQPVTLTGAGAYTGGTYSSSPSGLTINTSTGAITPSTSTPGTYTVTYTTSTSSGCAVISRTTQVIVTAVPTASINYTGNPFCKSITTAQAVTLAGTGTFIGGTFSASPSGLSINASTGAITPSTSTAATYTVTYTSPASGGCSSISRTTQVTITTSPTVGINYTGNPFCKSLTTQQVATLQGSGVYTGGTYSASPSGLTINSTTGAITPSTSTAGIYTVTYTTPLTNGCQASSFAQIVINAVPTASIDYTGSPFCKSLTTAQPGTLTGTGAFTGGTYTATPSGLSINSGTGAINPSLSTAGTYTVTYITSTSSGCAAVSTSRQVVITAIPTASISYSGNPYCKSLTFSQSVSLTGTGAYTGGNYSSSTGLSINASTGAINPSLSTAGTYTVTYTTPASGGCSAVAANNQITITAVPSATLTYAGSPYCKSLTSVQATTTGIGAFTGGTYTSAAGLSINAATGVINPSLSTAGTYTVTYTIPASGGCAAVATTTSVVVLPAPTASISADGVVATTTTITNGSAVQLQLNGTLNAQPNILWTPGTGISSATVANPVVYPSATTTYTASFINNNGCPQTTSFTVNVTPQPNIGNLSLSSPTATTIGLFDTITVDVQLTNATNLYSLYMKLKGNPAVSQYLDYSGYTAGTLLGTNVISTPPTVTNGVPDFGMTKVGAVPGYSGSGLFYSFRFVPKNITIPAGTTFCFYLDDVSSFNASGTPCGLTNQGQFCYTFTNQVAVWPGDLNKSNTVTTADILPIGYFYNSTGAARANATIQWNAQPATLWGYNRTSTNSDAYKVFADSNGDGVINNADQAAIGFNMNQVHNRMAWQAPDHFSAQAQQTLAAGSLTVTPNSTIINGAALPQTITFTVNLNNTGGLNALYGISVNLLFDQTVFDLSTATVDYTGSIFGNAGSDCLALNYNSDNTVSVGLTRFGNAPINGQGLLFKVTLQTKTTLPNLTQTPVTAYVDAANNQAGDTLVIQDAPATNFTIINNLGLDTIKQDEFVLYPNPASDVVYLQMGANTQLAGMKVKVVNLLGQVIEEQPIQNSTTELSTKNWGAAGVYFVQIINQNNTTSITKKVMVNRN